jgi:hypothetical protein
MADDNSSMVPGLVRFKHLAKKLKLEDNLPASSQTANASSGSADVVKHAQSQLDQYLSEIQLATYDQDARTFWKLRHASYNLLAPLAEDLLSAPASQAYVERIFSVCGWLTAGRRNRLTKNLEMRVFIKLNQKLLD